MTRFLTSHLSLLALALLVLVACSESAPELSYADGLLADRATKDRFFRESRESPIPEDRRTNFPALAYFPPDEAYRAPASLHVAAEDAGKIIQMPTSTGQIRLPQPGEQRSRISVHFSRCARCRRA